MITRAMRSTAGTEAMLRLEPLEIIAMESAIAEGIRIKSNGCWNGEAGVRLKEYSQVKIIDEIK